MEILEKDVNERKMEPVKDSIGVLSLHVIHMKRFPHYSHVVQSFS